jgi:hypothetical protein
MIATERRLDFGPYDATDALQGHPYGMLDPRATGIGRRSVGMVPG